MGCCGPSRPELIVGLASKIPVCEKQRIISQLWISYEGNLALMQDDWIEARNAYMDQRHQAFLATEEWASWPNETQQEMEAVILAYHDKKQDEVDEKQFLKAFDLN